MLSSSAKRNIAPRCKIRSQVMGEGIASIHKIAVTARRSVLCQAAVNAMGTRPRKWQENDPKEGFRNRGLR